MPYPTTIDSFPTHATGDVIDPDFDNAQQVAIAALEAKVGINGSADTNSLDYKNATITGSDQSLGISQTATVTNKKLSDSTTTVVAVADTTKGFRFSIAGTTGIIGFLQTAFTTAKTLIFPDANDTLVARATTDTLTNKSLSDSTTFIIDNTDATKRVQFEVSSVTTATTRTLTVPDANTTIVGTDATQTLTNKTITTPTITKPILNATNPTAQTYAPASGGTATLDCSLGNQHRITMPAGNITIAVSNDTNSQMFSVSILQDGVGSRTVTWFSTIRWAGGTVPTLTTTANKRDQFIFVRTGAATYDGFIVGQNI